MLLEIARVTEGLVKDDSVRGIVYRGAGTVAFASGADSSELQEQRKDAEFLPALRRGRRLRGDPRVSEADGRHDLRLLDGRGDGLRDLRFAAEGIKYGIPAAKLRIVCPPEAIGDLVGLVCPAYAKDIL